MIPGVTKGVASVEPRSEDGIFLGVSDRSDELYAGTERGMHKVRTVRRREATERVDLTFLNSVSARPWDGHKKVRDVRVVLPEVSSLAAMAESEATGKGRLLYVGKAGLMNHELIGRCFQGADALRRGSELKETPKDAVHDSKSKSPRTEEGRTRLTSAHLRGLPRDEGRGPGAGVEAPAAVSAPPRSDEVQDGPMNAEETSRKRSAEDAGHDEDDARSWRCAARSRFDC